MKKILCLICVISVIMLAGCQQSAQISTDQGNVQITGAGGDTNNWCMAGSTWNMDGAQTEANMVIEGIMTSGKYVGYCHVTYDMTTPQGDVHMDYYFNEEGAGYQVMDINGQRMETEWNS